MTRTALERRIAADPASVALLLAGPALDPSGHVPQVATDAPVRSPLGFTTRVRVSDGADLLARGLLTLVHRGRGPQSTLARLELEQYADVVLLPVTARWLDRLAATAEGRAYAA